jgi:hypothetical protein
MAKELTYTEALRIMTSSGLGEVKQQLITPNDPEDRPWLRLEIAIIEPIECLTVQQPTLASRNIATRAFILAAATEGTVHYYGFIDGGRLEIGCGVKLSDEEIAFFQKKQQ